MAQVAAEAALETDSSYFDAVRSEYRKRRDALVQGLNGIENVVCPVPGGAFYAFPDVTKLCGGDKGGFVEGFGPVKGSDEMCRYLLQEARVALVPGSAFGVDECIRISYAASDETLEKALDRITEALDPKKFKRSGSW